MIVNNLSEQCKAETREKDSETDSDRESIHSNWCDLIPMKVNKPTDVMTNDTTQRKRTVRKHSSSSLISQSQKIGGVGKLNPLMQLTLFASPILDDNSPNSDF